MDAKELEKRLADMENIGWDECSATGAGHSSDLRPQKDGLFYCQYCGAELLPEDQKMLAEEIHDEVIMGDYLELDACSIKKDILPSKEPVRKTSSFYRFVTSVFGVYVIMTGLFTLSATNAVIQHLWLTLSMNVLAIFYFGWKAYITFKRKGK